jgi:hypothetical protein
LLAQADYFRLRSQNFFSEFLLLEMKSLLLKKKERDQFALTVGTNTLGAIFRVAKHHTKKAEKDTVKTETHNGEPNKENTVSKEISTLKASNSARHQKKGFRNGN